MEKQTCRQCGETFPLTAEWFYKNSQRNRGFDVRCKTCRRGYMKAREKQWLEAADGDRATVADFAEFLRRARQDAGLSLTQVGAMCGCNESLIRGLEYGKGWGSLDKALKALDVLGFSVRVRKTHAPFADLSRSI